MRPVALALAFSAVIAAIPARAFGQSADNVLVVINDASPVSVQVGEYYIRKRAIAQDHVIRLKTVTTEGIARTDFDKTIHGPIADYLNKSDLVDKILYIVLTKGVPLRIEGTSGLAGTIASVDSELTLLYRRMVGSLPAPVSGRITNPYFLEEKPISEAKPFTRFTSDIYLVTRLDGYTVDDITKLIDRGMTPGTTGKIVLDQRAQLLDAGGDRWLQQAADRLRQSGAGDRVVLEMTKAVVQQDGPVLGYYSWGSNDQSNRLRHFGLQFAPGAIGAMFVSTDGRSFKEPPADWIPGGSDQRGYGSQSLTGDLIRDGITGVAGHVTEPLLDATIRPQILFPAYLAGFNLAESFYLSMPFLSWQTVVIGDPLCAPFSRDPLRPEQIAKGIDPDTSLPGLFSERRVELFVKGGLNAQAVKLSIKGDRQYERGDKVNGERDLAQAFNLDPGFIGVAIRLAAIYDEREDHAKAVETYRKALVAAPNNPIVLNNLAYDLAEYQHNPADALPLAEKAYGLARDTTIADTLAWIHHLLGDEQLALPLIEEALASNKDNAEMLMHAAFIHAALGDKAKAITELDASVKLNPKFNDRPDVKALREKLK